MSNGLYDADVSPDAAVEPEPVPPRRSPRRLQVDGAALLRVALLAVVLAVGAWLRLDAQNWDDYTHLHPDERFLTEVVTRLNGPLEFEAKLEDPDEHLRRCVARYPAVENADGLAMSQTGRGGYFDADCSPLNPNNVGKGFYVYGEFPLFTVRLAGEARTQLSYEYRAYLQAFDPDAALTYAPSTHWTGYNGAQFVGRTLAAVCDLLTVLVLFVLGGRLYNGWVGLLAAAFYGVAAFPIQQSQFWTVDAFTTLWVTLGLYFAIRALDGASARKGPLPLAYLAIWAVGAGWETAYWHRPVLGLVMLGAVFLFVLVVTGLVSAWARAAGQGWGELLVAASGVLASGAYLIGWAVLDATATADFSLMDGILSLGFSSLLFALVTLVAYLASGMVRRQTLFRTSPITGSVAVGAFVITWVALLVASVLDGVAPWSALMVALAAAALLVFDLTDLTDFALFGVALGAAVASRVNIAPLAGMIVLAAILRALPVLDVDLAAARRSRLVTYAMSGLVVAALVSLVVFRLLQPHAFMGPGLFGLKINSGWWDDLQEASYQQSGQWDVAPNYQWVDRTPYLFPWRNIVEWGLGVPLGLAAWLAWAWAGISILRGRSRWARHVIPFVWILGYFGWLGGRWVTTMRYFLPIYPALTLFGAWGLWSLAVAARRALRAHPVLLRRLAYGGAVALIVVTYSYTALLGFGMHHIHATQLTRVAASRWFQEFVPGDFGIWVEGDDGTRQMVNLGLSYVAPTARVYHLGQGESYAFATAPGQSTATTTVMGLAATPQPLIFPQGAVLEGIVFHRLGDPDRDAGAESVRARIWYDDPALGRQLVYEGTVTQDLDGGDSPYGREIALSPEAEVVFNQSPDTTDLTAGYVLEITALDGGPVMFSHGLTDALGLALSDISVTLRLADGSVTGYDFNLPDQPFLTGYGDDIPADPTQWSVGGRDAIPFNVPIDGEIRTIEIPHLGDVLRDADEETLTLTVETADGQGASATVTADFNQGADPLGSPRTLTLDPPLRVRAADDAGGRATATLYVESPDPIYTSGPVIGWEGSWDDPVPWPVCPLPDDVVYRDDLPSGLSSLTCLSPGMYGAQYQGIQLWMVAEDNTQKLEAMMLALDQADYLVITSNRFYDALTRLPMRWPMTSRFYDALFGGEMGYELVKTFESPPSLGSITLPDQILPTDDLPDVLNEQWEAEEAYHVYDHPVVFVFRKQANYSTEQARAILEGVSLRAVSTAVPAYVTDPDPVGVVPWSSLQADESPTMLQLDDEKAAIQREGGTWSDLFDMDRLVNRSQVAAVIVWWLLMIVAGWLAWPLLYAILPALPDRAYPVAKLVAWLVVAWIAWAGGTLNILSWTRPGLAVLLLALGALSAAVIWRRRAEFAAYVRAHWRHLLAMEALTGVLFAAFIGVRLGNPDLWHSAFGGEKPMDFAYFNAVLRSTVFPPIDPWSAGGYMNYYYFGYVIVGAPVKLLGVRPALAYNLILPTLYAMTGVSVFSLAYNWVRGRDEDAEPGRALRWLPLPRGNAWLAGLIALVLAMVIGNLGTVLEFSRQVAALDGWSQRPPLSQVRQDELEANRQTIYNRYYEEAAQDFRDEHGYEPTESADAFAVSQIAQQRTDEYIQAAARHPALTRIWTYGMRNLREQIGSIFAGIEQLAKGEKLQVPPHRWYWGPTRVIDEIPGSGPAIAEMPYFTYLYGDLHAHMIAMPVYLFALLWLLAEVMGAGQALRRPVEAVLALVLGGLAVGVLRPTNSWDWITFLILAPAALTFVAWIGAVRASAELPPSRAAARVWGWLRPYHVLDLWPVLLMIPIMIAARVAYYLVRSSQAAEQASRVLLVGETRIEATLTVPSMLLWIVAGLALVGLAYVALLVALRAYLDRPRLLAWLGGIALFLAASYGAALPFTRYFATAYTSVKAWEGGRTPLWAYFYVHGIFLFIVTGFLLWQIARLLRRVRVRDFEGQAVPFVIVGAAVLGGLLVSLAVGVYDVPALQVAGPLIIWATLMFFAPGQAPRLRMIYPLIVLALAITIGVEVIVLEGDIGRQNTVFKFYLQVWFFFSVIGGVVLAWMLHASIQWRLGLRLVWQLALAGLIAIGLMYPVMATQGRFLDRFNAEDTPLTLDGMEYMKYAVQGESGVWFSLEDDYRMIRWLQDNVEGSPVVMEAHQYPSEYHWNGRISIYTGLPTVLGWRWHQIQQHSLPQMDLVVQTRENNVAAFYQLSGDGGIRTAMNLIDAYDIEYIVVGALERAFYGDIVTDPDTAMQTAGHAAGLAKLDQMVEMGLLEVVYEDPGCLLLDVEECPAASVYMNRIYHVVPGAALPDVLAGDTSEGAGGVVAG